MSLQFYFQKKNGKERGKNEPYVKFRLALEGQVGDMTFQSSMGQVVFVFLLSLSAPKTALKGSKFCPRKYKSWNLKKLSSNFI